MVLDADVLRIVRQWPDCVRGYPLAILTPNGAEYERLLAALVADDGSGSQRSSSSELLPRLCQALGSVTIVRKGERDAIHGGTDAGGTVECAEPGSARRCGGQGDVLAGIMGTFAAWAALHERRLAAIGDTALPTPSWPVLAAFAACVATRRCAAAAFRRHGRTMTASDVVAEMGGVLPELCGDTLMPPARAGE